MNNHPFNFNKKIYFKYNDYDFKINYNIFK